MDKSSKNYKNKEEENKEEEILNAFKQKISNLKKGSKVVIAVDIEGCLLYGKSGFNRGTKEEMNTFLKELIDSSNNTFINNTGDISKGVSDFLKNTLTLLKQKECITEIAICSAHGDYFLNTNNNSSTKFLDKQEHLKTLSETQLKNFKLLTTELKNIDKNLTFKDLSKSIEAYKHLANVFKKGNIKLDNSEISEESQYFDTVKFIHNKIEKSQQNNKEYKEVKDPTVEKMLAMEYRYPESDLVLFIDNDLEYKYPKLKCIDDNEPFYENCIQKADNIFPIIIKDQVVDLPDDIKNKKISITKTNSKGEGYNRQYICNEVINQLANKRHEGSFKESEILPIESFTKIINDEQKRLEELDQITLNTFIEKIKKIKNIDYVELNNKKYTHIGYTKGLFGLGKKSLEASIAKIIYDNLHENKRKEFLGVSCCSSNIDIPNIAKKCKINKNSKEIKNIKIFDNNKNLIDIESIFSKKT